MKICFHPSCFYGLIQQSCFILHRRKYKKPGYDCQDSLTSHTYWAKNIKHTSSDHDLGYLLLLEVSTEVDSAKNLPQADNSSN